MSLSPGMLEIILSVATGVIGYLLNRSEKAKRAVNEMNELKDIGMRVWNAVEAIAPAMGWDSADKLAAAMERAELMAGRLLTEKQWAVLKALWKVTSEAAKPPVKKPEPAPAKKQSASAKRVSELKALREGR